MPKACLVAVAMLPAPEVSVHRAQVPSGPQATGRWVLPTALANRPSWKVMTVAVHSQGLSTAHTTCGLTDGHSQTALRSPSPRQPAASSVLQRPQDSRAARQAGHALWVSCHPSPEARSTLTLQPIRTLLLSFHGCPRNCNLQTEQRRKLVKSFVFCPENQIL